jgi:hypothetical protein
MTSPERYVLCEGYDDRAFWKQWLLHLGCREARDAVRGEGRVAYRSKSGRLVVVMPYKGLPFLETELEIVVNRRAGVKRRMGGGQGDHGVGRGARARLQALP